MKQSSQRGKKGQEHIGATLRLTLAAMPILALADADDKIPRTKRDVRISALPDAEEPEAEKKRRGIAGTPKIV